MEKAGEARYPESISEHVHRDTQGGVLAINSSRVFCMQGYRLPFLFRRLSDVSTRVAYDLGVLNGISRRRGMLSPMVMTSQIYICFLLQNVLDKLMI